MTIEATKGHRHARPWVLGSTTPSIMRVAQAPT